MLAFYSDHFVLPLPAGHRFPMSKYRRLRDAVALECPAVEVREAPRAADADLLRVHTPDYVEAVTQGTLGPAQQREIGFPWSEAMAERARRSVGATLAASQAAREEGVAVNLAGGTHHASAGCGSGFCVFNDVAVAARAWQADRPGARIAVIDLDVHQGNGTAAIFAGDASVFTLSLHGARNFPFRKVAGSLDVELPDDCDDGAYLHALDGALDHLARHFAPDMLFYLAGADPYAGDRLGRLALSMQGLQARDQCVLDWAWQRRLPLVLTMAGGYCEPIDDTVRIHLGSCQLAWRHWRRWQNLTP